MKYVILIHSNPQPWGHPTGEYNAGFQALPAAERARMDREFEELLTELHQNGELVTGEALGDPATATVYRWESGDTLATDGPYSEVKEHLAGFFMIDVGDRERAEQVARRFANPGDTIELRPAMWPGGGDD
ncbi:YciI family protein [Nocardioides sp. cx-173]|uniref:YciI family protein n=1 Tax=Nocardioides sp. cx-173 TaxID=2898796 RepID=UPI001E2FF882|nr:YciI family protein [Nocardioides sp. cx-173]MCD4523838.1 YciI family protein [Nocardioides sp. cx-173]UGB41842.1 YciI family protein [Nocardioides sp. cx-173]